MRIWYLLAFLILLLGCSIQLDDINHLNEVVTTEETQIITDEIANSINIDSVEVIPENLQQPLYVTNIYFDELIWDNEEGSDQPLMDNPDVPLGCSDTDGGLFFKEYGTVTIHYIVDGKHYYSYYYESCKNHDIVTEITCPHIASNNLVVALKSINPDPPPGDGDEEILSTSSRIENVETVENIETPDELSGIKNIAVQKIYKDCTDYGSEWFCSGGECKKPPPPPFCGDRVCTSYAIVNGNVYGEDCDTTTPWIIPNYCPEDCLCLVECGNDRCDPGETYFTCPEECPPPSWCGDGFCVSQELCDLYPSSYCVPENYGDCPYDCPPTSCGDSTCQFEETCINCLDDCDFNSDPELTCLDPPQSQGTYGCGDGHCIAFEDGTTCPEDCGYPGENCGDGYCIYPDTCLSCPADCGPCRTYDPGITFSNCYFDYHHTLECCGDGWCGEPDKMSSSYENVETCPQDCGNSFNSECGDGICQMGENCIVDCDITTLCGDRYCVSPENQENCLVDCGEIICGDGYCTSPIETEYICPQDCTNLCGDLYCDWTEGEDCNTCKNDCYSNTLPDCGCGNGFCVPSNENPDNCASDCFCGDGYCQEPYEDALTCMDDCGTSNGENWPPNCGDGICNSESCDNTLPNFCPQDCGPCLICY